MKSIGVKWPVFAMVVLLFACKEKYDEGTFGYDLGILQSVNDVVVLSSGKSMIAVAGEYQGRVLTSSSDGMSGQSYGWFNRDLIRENNYESRLSELGGEGRIWFGPEIGKYSVFFNPGDEQVVDNIRISPDLNTNLFNLIDKSDRSVTYGNTMSIRNANGYVFRIGVKRKLAIKSYNEIESEFGIGLKAEVSSVAFSSESWMKNIGNEQWSMSNGLLSIWDIGCMKTSANMVVIIPLIQDADSVTTYFTPLNENRIRIVDRTVLYKADALYMNKIGIKPSLCRNVFGSYSPELGLLTIVKYNFEHDSVYVNSLWGHTDPYKGDVVNVFNGEVNESKGFNWPFYEMESSSAARELQVGEEMYHKQGIFHFEGNKNKLDEICQKVLGVSLLMVDDAF